MSDYEIPELPECFCPTDAECDWDFYATVGYKRQNDKPGPHSEVTWPLKNIPQALAQVMLQTTIDVVNRQGASVYLAWLEGCVGSNSDAYKMIEKMMKDRGLDDIPA